MHTVCLNNTDLWVLVHSFFFLNLTILGSELIVNIKDFPKAIVGDIVEVYHSDSEQNKLLLQIMAFKDDLQSKGKLLLYKFLNSFYLVQLTNIHTQ